MNLERQYSIEELITIINNPIARVIGDKNIKATGINEIHRVVPGDITFVDNEKYFNRALSCLASIILINKEVEAPDGKVLIYSDDPFRDYVKLVKFFAPFQPQDMPIHPSAEIGEGTIIQPLVFIGPNVKIGKNCIIHPNVTIHANTIIGNNVIINSGSVIGGEAFYFKRRPDYLDKLEGCGRVVIEDDVEIGSCCTIDRGVSSDTIIGKGTKLDNLIQVGHDTIIGKNCLIAAQAGIAGVVNMEDNVILWGQVGVQKDLTIGKGAIILGQSGVAKSIEGGKVYFGSPAREASDKMREIALLKKLPELFDAVNKLMKNHGISSELEINNKDINNIE
ncbi:MAG TPA: UDP-3-O-(3-hydroxymyristoyl)glucosamine N-acyltransferase [Bacteroidales bacterium]|nr:UDP-3-O-(3-hydroxymyristoyl)glucosamine N-acyltransferase [Bacteroidales bacterium]